MTAYVSIADSDIDPDSPITTSLMTALRNNPIAITEKASGAPQLANDYVTNAMIATNAVNADSIAAGAVGTSEIATNGVGSAEIASGAVQVAKLESAIKPWIQLDTDTRSSASGYAYLSGFSTTYDEYLFVAYNATRLGSDDALLCRTRNGGAWAGSQFTILTMDTSVDSYCEAKIHQPRVSKAQYMHIMGYSAGGAPALLHERKSMAHTGVFDEIALYTSGAAQFTGTFELYGRRK